ncbi:DUF2934 domain-containing protein [Neorhizobium alkalisoli]|uniref:DUF2934 domain-containing protein n=1 Tax=Neorhizobium alkalisoli TaxID=528178 RepID=UPI000CF8AE0A|nr:DUF2934 domain-containing protein [Neorhizobium alkalisoli]
MTGDEDQIRQRAYEIWEQEGRPHGEDLRHWIRAFEELETPRGKAAQLNKRDASKSDENAPRSTVSPKKVRATPDRD